MATSDHQRIEQLIQETGDPVVRATLLVLSGIESGLERTNISLTENTVATKGISRSLDKHIQDEEKMLASVRGGQWVGATMLAVLIAMAWYIVQQHFDRNNVQDSLLSAHDRRISVLEDKVNAHHEAAKRNGTATP